MYRIFFPPVNHKIIIFIEDLSNEPSDRFIQVVGLCFASSIEENTWKERLRSFNQNDSWNVYKDITRLGCQHLCSNIHNDTCKTLMYYGEPKLCTLTYHLWNDLVTREEELRYDCGSKVPNISVYNRNRNIDGRSRGWGQLVCSIPGCVLFNNSLLNNLYQLLQNN